MNFDLAGFITKSKICIIYSRAIYNMSLANIHFRETINKMNFSIAHVFRRRIFLFIFLTLLALMTLVRIEVGFLKPPNWTDLSQLKLSSKIAQLSEFLQKFEVNENASSSSFAPATRLKKGKQTTTQSTTTKSTTTKSTTTKSTPTKSTTSKSITTKSTTKSTKSPVVKKSIFKSKKKKKCFIREHHLFPSCLEKFNELKNDFDNKCYRKHGVDGSNCTILEYLTTIEPYCMGEELKDEHSTRAYATPRFDLEGVLKLLPEVPFSWLRQRAKLLWPDWVEAGKQFMKHKTRWRKKKVVVYMFAVANSGFLKRAGRGGPLGELVQWTDLICGLYILGYDLQVAAKPDYLTALDRDDKNNCATYNLTDTVDIIYLDINSIQMLAFSHGKASTAKYRCMFRILDSFGTYPEFNVKNFPHPIKAGPSGWGKLDMITTQFLTLYPHTHDNSFLGFVVGSNQRSNVTKSVLINNTKEMALVYAKHSSYFRGEKELAYLKVVSEYFNLHATAVVSKDEFPSFITNHGPVSNSKVQELLRQSKLFVGVGFPFEGPGPMEAMAGGAIFLQPKFAKPQNKLNNAFFGGKPTFRELTSQSPYMEEFVGELYCYTIDIKNETLLRSTLQKIKDMKPLPPKIPKEFTNEGMLERIHIFTEHMDYCNPFAPRWPPIDHLQTFIAMPGQSCKDLCMSKGLVCERSYFLDINTQFSIERYGNVKCDSVQTVDFLHPPSYEASSKICYLQKNTQHYSCMHQQQNLTRLCPCRDYEIEQVSICNHCLR